MKLSENTNSNKNIANKVKKSPQYILNNPAPHMMHEPPEKFHKVLERIRTQTQKNGVRGFVELERAFSSFNKNGLNLINLQDFTFCMKSLNLKLSSYDIEDVFKFLDSDSKGLLSIESLLNDIRGSISIDRKRLIQASFDKLDEKYDQAIDLHILVTSYNAEMHPKVISGEKPESEIMKEFLENFETKNVKDNKVTMHDFEKYHLNLSATIPDEKDFENVMRNVWSLGNEKIQIREFKEPNFPRIMRPRERSPPPVYKNGRSNYETKTYDNAKSTQNQNTNQDSHHIFGNEAIKKTPNTLFENKNQGLNPIKVESAGSNDIEDKTKDKKSRFLIL